MITYTANNPSKDKEEEVVTEEVTVDVNSRVITSKEVYDSDRGLGKGNVIKLVLKDITITKNGTVKKISKQTVLFKDTGNKTIRVDNHTTKKARETKTVNGIKTTTKIDYKETRTLNHPHWVKR